MEAAEHIAISSGNIELFRFLFSCMTIFRMGPQASSQTAAKISHIIQHQRLPVPFILVCDIGSSYVPALQSLLRAGKWAAADGFVRSFVNTHPWNSRGASCWNQLASAYLASTTTLDRWQAGGPGPLREAVIDCARQGKENGPTALWRRIFCFCVTKGGSEQALAVAEEAAVHFCGETEMSLLVTEHSRAGNPESALRCQRKAAAMM